MLVTGWGGTTRTLIPWRQGLRDPTRNDCTGCSSVQIASNYTKYACLVSLTIWMFTMLLFFYY